MEAWVGPDDDPATPTAVHERGDDGESAEAVALRTVAEYLSFDGRRRAEFVRGGKNAAALLDG